MSEREKLEGAAGRKDPLKTQNNASTFALFGILAVVIMLWPVWFLITSVVIMVGFCILWAFADSLAMLPAKQIDAVILKIAIGFVVLFLLVIIATAILILCICNFRKNQKCKIGKVET
jgi:hypothetical protein